MIAVVLLGCGPVPVRPDPVDPGDDVGDSCTIACAVMQQLGCPGWRGSPGEDEEYGTEDDEYDRDLSERCPSRRSHEHYPANCRFRSAGPHRELDRGSQWNESSGGVSTDYQRPWIGNSGLHDYLTN